MKDTNKRTFVYQTNPVRDRRKYSPSLDLENFGLSGSDLDLIFQAGEEVGLGAASLRSIITHLNSTYCQSIGIEYMYLRNPEDLIGLKKKWQPSKSCFW